MELVNYINSIYIGDEHPLNVSDHLPVCLSIDITMFPSKPSNTNSPTYETPKYKWRNYTRGEIHHAYTKPLRSELSRKMYDYSIINEHCYLEQEQIDTCIADITKVILSTTDTNIAKHSFKKWQKPFWSPNLQECAKFKKRAYSAWVCAGKPCYPLNSTRLHYKEIKARLRRLIRRAHYAKCDEFVTSLHDTEINDTRSFWRLINGARGNPQSKRCTPMKDESGTILSNPNAIRQRWVRHFRLLSTPDENCSNTHSTEVKSKLSSYASESLRNEDIFLGDPFKLDEIREVQLSLKLGKAGGVDFISAEHVKFGGLSLAKMLMVIFNSIAHTEYIPINFKKGIIIPLFKGGNKDPTVTDNYRGITLKTIFTKMFEKLCLMR